MEFLTSALVKGEYASKGVPTVLASCSAYKLPGTEAVYYIESI